MTPYSIEYYEIRSDWMEELHEWEDFEADMATNPYDDPRFD